MSKPGIAAAVVLVAGCAHAVNQDASTGEDGLYDGAEPIELARTNQEARHVGLADGTVSYPGGDRVDWKVVVIPEARYGRLDLALTWTSPRPGLDLAFDVYSAYGERLGGVRTRKSGKSKDVEGDKSLTVADAKGTIYIEVYASNRPDAGDYELEVVFLDETRTTIGGDDLQVEIPLPPRLALVYPPCDPDFDKGNPDCKGPPPPPKVCPSPPDRDLPECGDKFPACTDENYSKDNPNCDDYPDPALRPPPSIEAFVVGIGETNGGWTDFLIHKGTDDGLTDQWTGIVVDDDDRPVKGGEFKLYKVFKDRSEAKVKLSKSILQRNQKLVLSPPPPAIP